MKKKMAKGGLLQMGKGPKTMGGKQGLAGGSPKKTEKDYGSSIKDPGYKKGGLVKH